MFNQIYGGGGVLVNGSTKPYCSTTGILRWNGGTQKVEVMEPGSNSAWTPIPDSMTNINLDPHTQEVLMWASKKMNDEKRLEYLCEKHPGLKDLHEKFEIMLALVRKHEGGNDGGG